MFSPIPLEVAHEVELIILYLLLFALLLCQFWFFGLKISLFLDNKARLLLLASNVADFSFLVEHAHLRHRSSNFSCCCLTCGHLLLIWS